jgi:hypothetical protein
MTGSTQADRLDQLDEALRLIRVVLVKHQHQAALAPLAKVTGTTHAQRSVAGLAKIVDGIEQIRTRQIARAIQANDVRVLAKVSASERQAVGEALAKVSGASACAGSRR